jgi:hypothetical protein
VELVLHLADEPARAFQAASRQLGRPVLSLRTDDYQRQAERLKAKGVVFVKEPAGCPTAASTRCSPTPAATCSTSTRTEKAPSCSPPANPDRNRSHRCCFRPAEGRYQDRQSTRRSNQSGP